jgi:D-aspartate ligase
MLRSIAGHNAMTLRDRDQPSRLADARSRLDGAVILGGAHGSLAVARSLGRRGVPVWLVTHDHPIAKYSRYVAHSFDWPGPSSEGAARWLVDLAADFRLDRWVLFAGGDEEVRLVAQQRAMLEQAYRVVTPPWDIVRVACDKRLTDEHARAVGVDSPWTRYPRDREEAAALDCRFPVILKPRIHRGCNAFVAAKAWRVDDRAALLSRYDAAAALVGPDAIAVQELISGGGDVQFSYAALWSEGAPVASLVARRSRQYPVDFGFTSTLVETIERPAIEEAASRFLLPLRFSGLVELEFKYDARDSRYKLLDVNPRLWTWIALAGAAGVDLPWMQWRLAHGQSVAPARGLAGVRWAHASRDIVSAVQQMASGVLAPRDYFASPRSTTFAAFAADDPLPGILDLPVLAARVIRRRFLSQARRLVDKESR